MGTALAVYDETSEDGELRVYEQEVYQAEQELRESFYHIGMALKRIKDDEPFKPKVGQKPNGKTTFKSWAAYCASKRCMYPKQSAERFIRSAAHRDLLPELKSGTTFVPFFWTQDAVLQIARLKDKQDVRNAVSQIRKALKGDEKFSTALVRRIVDDILGVTHEKMKKKKKELADAPTLADSLHDMTDTVETWMDSLGQVEGDLWSEVETESPGSVKRLTQVLSEFISFLKG